MISGGLLRFFISPIIIGMLHNLVCLDRDGYETTKDFSFLDEEDKEKGEEYVIFYANFILL